MSHHRRRHPIAVSLALAALIGTAACGTDADSRNEQELRATTEAPSEAPAPLPAAGSAEAEGTDGTEATLAATFAEDPRLTVFGRIFETSRLGQELDGEEVTIFAPDNAAFASVSEPSVAGEANARTFVLRHTVSGAHESAALESRTQVRPREGQALEVRTEDGALWVGGGQVLDTHRVGDAVVHIVSRVATGES